MNDNYRNKKALYKQKQIATPTMEGKLLIRWIVNEE